ncbi:MAG: PKD domain-containing protein, partial [Phycisphaerales bacterium]|nr:PKD domain-containing protein [Phycisphaerales bacterium]
MRRSALAAALVASIASAQTPTNVNLLINGGGDSPGASVQGSDNGQDFYSLPNWTPTQGTWMAQVGPWFGIEPFAGTRFVRTHQDASNRLTQSVSIDLPAGGPFHLTLRGAVRNWDTASDQPRMTLDLYQGAALVASGTTGAILDESWAEYAVIEAVPGGVTSAVVTLEGTRTSGSYNDCYFDDVQLILTEGTPLVPTFDVEIDLQSWPPTATFTDTTAGPVTSRSWDFGDGEFDVGSSVVHQYAGPGTFDVSLTVTSPGRIDAVTREGAVVVEDPGGLEIIKGPYLQYATQDAMTVMWETNLPGDSVLHYFDGIWKQATSAGPTLIHEVRVTGFDPGQQVPYLVETTVGGTTVQSTEATFTTAPVFGAPVRFGMWGDNQDRPEVFSQLIAHMIDDEPDLLVAMGDLVSTGSDYDQWDNRLFGPLRPLIRTTPMISS